MYTQRIRPALGFHSSSQFHVAISMTAVAAGAGIYWLFRGIPLFHGTPLIVLSTTVPLVAFFIFSVPDGLWLYGLLSAVQSVWEGQGTTSEKIWLYSVFALSLCTEYAQYVHILHGTFDLLDLGAYFCAGSVFLYFNNHIPHSNPQL